MAGRELFRGKGGRGRWRVNARQLKPGMEELPPDPGSRQNASSFTKGRI
ncbi:MAG TPA: hypothetical protein GXX25_10110 [Desulfotomaculum sp.]|nr:hypothetical protein [Desulfotomaculum sp.]